MGNVIRITIGNILERKDRKRDVRKTTILGKVEYIQEDDTKKWEAGPIKEKDYIALSKGFNLEEITDDEINLMKKVLDDYLEDKDYSYRLMMIPVK